MHAPVASPAQLRAYLDRIGFDGNPAPDLDTLRRVHRLHAETIPWESLHVPLARHSSRDPADAFAKLVEGRRGGWCYEMNGLLAWMLEAIGFTVRRLAGGVGREQMGDFAIGNHLVLLVELDRPWIADVGFGTGLLEPVPLEEGPIDQPPMRFALERIEDGWWRFRNHEGLAPPSFDFSPELTGEALLEERCQWLRSDTASPFWGRAVVHRYFADRLEIVDIPVHRTLTAEGLVERPLADAGELAAVLRDRFGIDEPDAAALWEEMARRRTQAG